jgi:hypothetical protein
VQAVIPLERELPGGSLELFRKQVDQGLGRSRRQRGQEAVFDVEREGDPPEAAQFVWGRQKRVANERRVLSVQFSQEPQATTSSPCASTF